MTYLPLGVIDELRTHHGVVSRATCLAAGMTPRAITGRVQRGEWIRVYRGVYQVATAPPTPEAALVAACMAAGPGAVASHVSAAWLWGMRDDAPLSVVSVPRGRDPRRPGLEVHRVRDLDPSRIRTRRGIPCTDPLRTLVDVAAVADAPDLDEMLDRAMAIRLVSVEGLQAEAARLGRPGRRGGAALVATLLRRGLIGGPHPSVLESRLLRVLHGGGIAVQATEVVVYRSETGSGYRLDTLIVPGLAVEVDGFRYHRSPERKTADEGRRNRLRLGGLFLLVYTWWDVLHDPDRIISQVRRKLDELGTPQRAAQAQTRAQTQAQ